MKSVVDRESNSDVNEKTRPSEGLSSAFLGDFFSRLVAFSLPVTYFLVTISFYLRTYDSAQIKITLTQAGCGMVILFWALQLIFQKRWPFSKKDLPMVAPFLAILASGIFSYFHSSFRAGSLEEFSRRVFYSFMALIVIAEFRGMDRQRRLMRWLIASFAVTVFYGFVQYFDGRLFPPGLTKVGLDPFIWRQAFSLRVFSSFGNPNFYGNFLVIITPILIALFFRNGGGTFRPFILIGLVVVLVYLTDKLFANYFGGITAQNQIWVTGGLIVTLLLILGLIWWQSPSASASGMMIFLTATFINLYATETKGAWVGFVAAMVSSAILVDLFLIRGKYKRGVYGLLAIIIVIAAATLIGGILYGVVVFFLGCIVITRYLIKSDMKVALLPASDKIKLTWKNVRHLILTYGLIGVSIVVATGGFVAVRHYANQRKQSVDFRVFTWIATWDMIKTQPWLGTGIGSFKWAYPAFRRPEIILLEGRSNTETDHAEDEYLEVMYDEGMIGFGIFLWLIISVSVMGLRMLNRLTKEGPRPPPSLQPSSQSVDDRRHSVGMTAPPVLPFDDKVYKILAYLGAWWAALIHWFMDVSVRFVSSGIFSFFLPALVTSFIRNDPMPEQQDRPTPNDLWVRLSIVFLFMGFFIFPDEHWRPLIGPSGVLFVGACIIVLAELLERHLTVDAPGLSSLAFLVSSALCATSELFEISSLASDGLNAGHLIRIFSAFIFFFFWTVIRRMETLRPRWDQAVTPGPKPSWAQTLLALVAISIWVMGASLWRGYFLADVSHNVAIFFSKQMIWNRSSESDQKVNAAGFPDDMKIEYDLVGGALEHYEKTFRLNPGFPMAVFFIGNVHNDWGSTLYDASRQARERGDTQGAETLRLQAVQHWEASLDAYARVKAFAPNYVQSHHQVGLVYLKMGEMDTALGDKEKAKEHWTLALKNFDLYHSLDPVFPPNYYRQSYIYFNQGDVEKAEQAYLGALVYNSTNVVNRVYYDRNTETYSSLGRLFYVQLVNKYPDPTRLPEDSLLFTKAETYYLKALEVAKESGQEETIGVEPAKSLAVLYSRVGRNDKAKDLWLKLRQWAPEDADVKRVFSPPADPNSKK